MDAFEHIEPEVDQPKQTVDYKTYIIIAIVIILIILLIYIYMSRSSKGVVEEIPEAPLKKEVKEETKEETKKETKKVTFKEEDINSLKKDFANEVKAEEPVTTVNNEPQTEENIIN